MFLSLYILLDFVAVPRQILGFPFLQQLRSPVRDKISTRAAVITISR